MIKQSVSTVFRGLKRLRFANSYSAFTKSVKRNVYAIMVAFALGMSNVMLMKHVWRTILKPKSSKHKVSLILMVSAKKT